MSVFEPLPTKKDISHVGAPGLVTEFYQKSGLATENTWILLEMMGGQVEGCARSRGQKTRASRTNMHEDESTTAKKGARGPVDDK